MWPGRTHPVHPPGQLRRLRVRSTWPPAHLAGARSATSASGPTSCAKCCFHPCGVSFFTSAAPAAQALPAQQPMEEGLLRRQRCSGDALCPAAWCRAVRAAATPGHQTSPLRRESQKRGAPCVACVAFLRWFAREGSLSPRCDTHAACEPGAPADLRAMPAASGPWIRIRAHP